ncbi:MAG: helicase-related protein [Candidatus Pacebacteria bacterium]|nr:helicase-related protein [Candidatus Paceibacterota bacterium]
MPVFQFKNEILEAVKNNPVIIITAKTGAGKSTQVPQYLLDEGYNIVVTQPRRLAARTVAQRVAEEYGSELGGIVGFCTAYERQDSRITRCLFATDGLAMVRELMGAGQHNVLVLDEAHEGNLNIEVLIAWAQHKIEAGADFKVVVMSATMESGKLSEYFGGASVIDVPGRLFPVEEREAGNSMEEDVVKLLKEGRNVLVFQPGKKEITDMVSKLKSKVDLDVEILPLHGGLTPEEQNACFKHYVRSKCIVSTNVAQTSVTIDDIDAVVDSGMERRVELVDGVEGLYLKPISKADAAQRKGRAGRTKPGIYIDYCDARNRLEFPKAEILRVRLDQAVLRLAEVGIDVEELEFFHQPDKKEIHEAKRALKALGCMDNDGGVTEIGHKVAKLPISVKYGRMVVEAEKRGAVNDVITIAALLEQGEITARKIEGVLGKHTWSRLCPGENESDIMAQLAVYQAAENMTKEEMTKNGVFVKAYYQAKEKRRHLADSLRRKIHFGSSGDRKQILMSICAGMVDHLYHYDCGDYRNGDGQDRQLSENSLVEDAEWLVGLPFDLEIKTRRGEVTLNLVTMATKVEPKWLAEVAPQLVRTEEGIDPVYIPDHDSCFSTEKTFFQDQKIGEERIATPEHLKASEVFIDWLAGRMIV